MDWEKIIIIKEERKERTGVLFLFSFIKWVGVDVDEQIHQIEKAYYVERIA